MMASHTALRDRIKEATATGKAKILHIEAEAEKLVRRVVEKGRDAQAEGKKRLEDLMGKSPLFDKVRDADLLRRIQELRSDVEERLEGGMDRLLELFGVATAEKLDKLTRRMDTLTSRVNELMKRQKAAKGRPAGGQKQK
jgi:polyhydroxyalkanoate synthesis regulator phasin